MDVAVPTSVLQACRFDDNAVWPKRRMERMMRDERQALSTLVDLFIRGTGPPGNSLYTVQRKQPPKQ